MRSIVFNRARFVVLAHTFWQCRRGWDYARSSDFASVCSKLNEVIAGSRGREQDLTRAVGMEWGVRLGRYGGG